ncbi:hypothetical protein BJX63DRAFT_380777 [Aspergillus granulosus]|uniref:Uncharacterized protein n=1 Tax=Aspergillus granulosus TaxID=176169 RepID=A0ABR4HY67_9EURO
MDHTRPIPSTKGLILQPPEALPSSVPYAAPTPYKWSQPPGLIPGPSQRPLQYISLDTTNHRSSVSQLPSAEGHRRILRESEFRELMRYVFEHRDQYADRNYSRKRFWQDLSHCIKGELGKDIRQPSRIVKRLVANRQAQLRGEGLAVSEAISDPELKQTLDKWIEFVDGLDRQRMEENSNRPIEQQINRQIAVQERDNVRTRQVDWIAREEEEGLEEEISIANTPSILSPTPVASSSVSTSRNTSRKRRRTADAATRIADALEICIQRQNSQLEDEERLQRFTKLINDRFKSLEQEMTEIKGLLAQIARDRDRQRG